MSEQPDAESRTEEATEKKIHEAREKGNVPFSREASILASLVAMLIAGHLVVVPAAMRLTGALTRMLDIHGQWRIENGVDAMAFLAPVAFEAGMLVLFISLIFLFCGLAGSFAQNLPSVSLDRIIPDFSRISPGAGLKRLFSFSGQIEFGKSTLKLLAVSYVALASLRDENVRIAASVMLDPGTMPGYALAIFMRLVAALAIAMALIVAADVAWSRFKWRKGLRMNKQEVKDEYRQSEGDPLIKARMRSIAQDRSRRRMIASVPRATMVIANPTHFAIALRYVREEGGAPIVLAKGQDLIALKIRELAEKHNIPVVEDKALARSMYKAVGVEQSIPPEFYRAVASLVHILQTEGENGLRRKRAT